MQTFLMLNRELRTDHNHITHLLDNVSSIFQLPEANSECYFQFDIHFDLNKEGTIKIFYESRKQVRVFISDSIKKPSAINCDMTILPNEVPKDYTPFK